MATLHLANFPPSTPYLPALIGIVKTHYPHLNERLFTAVLLCVVAGKSNLIVRTDDEDISLAATATLEVRYPYRLL